MFAKRTGLGHCLAGGARCRCQGGEVTIAQETKTELVRNGYKTKTVGGVPGTARLRIFHSAEVDHFRTELPRMKQAYAILPRAFGKCGPEGSHLRYS